MLSRSSQGIRQHRLALKLLLLRRCSVSRGVAAELVGMGVLMGRYYERLMEGDGRSEALRQVQWELMQTGAYSHPYCWINFIFSGNWQSLEEWQ